MPKVATRWPSSAPKTKSPRPASASRPPGGWRTSPKPATPPTPSAAQMDEQITQKYMADQQLKGTMAQIKANSTMTQKDWLMGAIGLASGLGSAAMMSPAKSDVRSKYAFQDPDIRDLQDYLGRTKGKLYRYKNPSAPGQRPGLNYGPMAQALASTKIGRTVVVEGKDG